MPVAALGGQLVERQPAPIADLDGVAATLGGEQAQHIGVEKGGVRARDPD